mmetsp:Transcript_12964/g.19527  ORF Transcript_12964/g.19527 Transcript_12964/m.19527 type:complete len:579 (-) Transcript_12964:200-1936(-)
MSFSLPRSDSLSAKVHPKILAAQQSSATITYTSTHRDIEEIESIDTTPVLEYEHTKYPDPPHTVHVHCSDCHGMIWWEYSSQYGDRVSQWEVRRYRRDRDGSWSIKGVKCYKDMPMKRFHLTDLELNHYYRFTVSAINKHGRGPESRMSNTIYVEQPLPAGWFRATSSDDTFFYYNLNTGCTSKERPDLDPYFIPDEVVVKMFAPHEVSHLREVYDEEILHFDKVKKDRLRDILLELGESFTPRECAVAIREHSVSTEAIYSWQVFMEVMYTMKTKAIKNKNITQQATNVWRRLFSCFEPKEVVSSSTRIEMVGSWDVRRSKAIDRVFYFNKAARKRKWVAPIEVRLYLPEDGTLLESAEMLYDPVELDLIKNAYCHMDIDSTGNVDIVEFFRFMFVAANPTPDPTATMLPPNSATERANLFAAVCLTNSSAGLKYQDFLRMMVTLKRGKKDEVKEYHDAMPALAEFSPSRATLAKSTERYLIARKQGRFEQENSPFPLSAPKRRRSSEGSRKYSTVTDEVQEFDDESAVSVGKTLSSLSDTPWFKRQVTFTTGPNGEVVEHSLCCMCGCRESLYYGS